MCPFVLQLLGTMFTEVLAVLLVGGLIFLLKRIRRRQVLMTEDGWWGAEVPYDRVEDTTIRPFTVTTNSEELKVTLIPDETKWTK